MLQRQVKVALEMVAVVVVGSQLAPGVGWVVQAGVGVRVSLGA